MELRVLMLIPMSFGISQNNQNNKFTFGLQITVNFKLKFYDDKSPPLKCLSRNFAVQLYSH